MRLIRRVILGLLVVGGGFSIQAASLYVAQNGQAPGDFQSWGAAASNIQDAVNAAAINDTVWVGAGHYYGAAVPSNYYGNSVVVIDKALTLRSSNSVPDATIIDGGGVNRGVAIKNAIHNPNLFIIDGFTITNGYATNFGGGIVASYPSGFAITVTVQNCTITDNTSSNMGGGVFALNTACNLTISNCVIRNNLATNNTASGLPGNIGGGGLFASCRCLIADSVIRGNRWMAVFPNSNNGGGGVCLQPNVHTIRNTLIYGNGVAPDGGGAIYLFSGSGVDQSLSVLNLINCTIAYNLSGGALRVRRTNCTVNVINSIIYTNYPGDLPAPNILWMGANGVYTNLYLTYSCTPSNGLVGVFDASNVTNNPAFVDLSGGDFRLKYYSRCVDAGVTQVWMSGATDLAGQPRVSANSLVDMGAYETTYSPNPGYYAAHNGQTPVSPYTNWLTAASNIQDAVNVYDVDYPATVWVGSGTYTVPPSPVVYLGTNVLYINKLLTLRSSNGVPASTIIDGGGSNRGIVVYYGANNATPFVLDGFTISNCYAPTAGGGILIEPVNKSWTSVVQNCVISDNSVGATAASDYGGGIGAYATISGYYLLVSNCTIRGNHNFKGNGGGVYGAKLVVGCLIANNTAISGGGGVNVPIYANCEFSGNMATGTLSSQGGGAVSGGYVTFTNCLAYNNSAVYDGGFVWSQNQGPLSFSSCTIVSNRASYTGAIRMESATDRLTIENSIIFSNRTGGIPWSEFSRVAASTSYIMNSCFRTNGIKGLIIGSGNITNADPLFVNVAGQNFRLLHGSPCINTGSNQAWMVGALDVGGNPRLSPLPDGPVDMGAYEFPIQSGSVFTVR